MKHRLLKEYCLGGPAHLEYFAPGVMDGRDMFIGKYPDQSNVVTFEEPRPVPVYVDHIYRRYEIQMRGRTMTFWVHADEWGNRDFLVDDLIFRGLEVF